MTNPALIFVPCIVFSLLWPTLSPQLIFDRFHASLLLDEVIDDLGGLFVLQLRLGDAAHVEEVLQLGIQVVQLCGRSKKKQNGRVQNDAGVGFIVMLVS